MTTFKLNSENLAHIVLYISNLKRGTSCLLDNSQKNVRGIKEIRKSEIENFITEHYSYGKILHGNNNKPNPDNLGIMILFIILK